MEKLFNADGTEFSGTVVKDEKGHAGFMHRAACRRCGGSGHYSFNLMHGTICFRCRGAKFEPRKFVRLFTATELAKRNASAEKRAVKKALKAEIAAGVAAVEFEEKKSEFVEAHGALMERARAVADRNAFIADVLDKGEKRATWSEKQILALTAAVERAERDLAAASVSSYFGNVGDRVTVDVTVERTGQFEVAAFGYAGRRGHTNTMFIVTMTDGKGHYFVSKSTSFNATKGDTFTMTGTIKKHEEYKGMKQTVVTRVTTNKGASNA